MHGTSSFPALAVERSLFPIAPQTITHLLLDLIGQIPADTWQSDPGALLLALELVGVQNAQVSPEETAALLAQPLLRRCMLLEFMAVPDYPLAAWDSEPGRTVYRAAHRVAGVARILAGKAGYPERPAQWSALASVCAWAFDSIGGGIFPPTPEAGARAVRRFVYRHQWPQWLERIVSRLWDGETAPLDAQDRLLAIVELALHIVRQRGDLWLPDPPRARSVLLELLHVDDGIAHELANLPDLVYIPAGLPVAAQDWVRRLWHTTWQILRRVGAGDERCSERELEALEQALARCRADDAVRLRDAKLRALAQMACGAAHEINNPLAVIVGHAQRLLRQETDAERIAALHKIVGQARRIHELLIDLLFFARPPIPRLEHVALAPLLRQVVRQAARDADSREVVVQCARIPRVTVQADRSLLSVALTELIRNAVGAAPAGGRVTISVEADRSQCRIVVEDNGPGLSALDGEHLFDPFYSGRSAGRGRGLGLSKVWRIAQLLQGQIGFESQPGLPTRFIFTVPRVGCAPRGRRGCRADAAPDDERRAHRPKYRKKKRAA